MDIIKLIFFISIVAYLFLFDKYKGIKIFFVIIGFSLINNNDKIIYDDNKIINAKNIVDVLYLSVKGFLLINYILIKNLFVTLQRESMHTPSIRISSLFKDRLLWK